MGYEGYVKAYRKGMILRKLGMDDKRIPRSVRAQAIRDYRTNRRVSTRGTGYINTLKTT